MRSGFPLAYDGMRVGLLGGSFDPAHAGHLHITETAITRLGLDQVWWLVSPGNPLKAAAPADLSRRMLAAETLVAHRRRIHITNLEARLGTRYTIDTLSEIRNRYRGVRFVWLMGADNMVQIHRWRRWAEIFMHVPVAVLARPGSQLSAGLSLAAHRFARYRLPESNAAALPFRAPPCWTLIHHRMSPLSSTVIRASGQWQ